jgi:hypothetical protein
MQMRSYYHKFVESAAISPFYAEVGHIFVKAQATKTPKPWRFMGSINSLTTTGHQVEWAWGRCGGGHHKITTYHGTITVTNQQLTQNGGSVTWTQRITYVHVVLLLPLSF